MGQLSVDGGFVSDSQAESAGSIPVTRSTREKHCKTGEFEDSSERAPPNRIRAVIELVIADPAAGAADPLATTQSQHVKTHPSRNSMGLD